MKTFMLLRARAFVVVCAFLIVFGVAVQTPIESHDFGGGSGPGPPPPPDGCPGCCGGGGGGDPCGEGGPGCGSSGSPVNFWDGSESFTTADVRIDGYFPIEFHRTYDSRVDYDSHMGYGWAHSYDLRVFRYPDGNVMLRRTCGRRGLFVPSGGSYISPPGEFRNTLLDEPGGTVTLVESTGKEYAFDLRGRLQTISDVNGNSLELEYDPAGRLPLVGTSRFSPNPTVSGVVALEYRITRIRERDALGSLTGREITMAYDPSTGRMESVTDHTGRVWTYEYDSIGNLTIVQGPESIVYSYGYDDPNDPHNLTSMNEGLEQLTLVYDSEDRVIQQTVGTGTVWDIEYTVPGLTTAATKTVKDDQGVVIRTAVSVYEFNSFGNPTKVTDALGNEFTYTRDGEGNTMVKEVRQNVPGTGLVLIKTVAMTYDAAGNLITEMHTQADTGEVVTKLYTYDGTLVATQRMSSSLDPGVVHGFDNVYDHNARGLPTTLLTETRIISDADQPTQQSFVVTNGYDSFGQRTLTTFPNADTETFAYTNGYLTDNNGETYTRDALGNILTRTDRNSNTFTQTYDQLSRITTATDPEGNQLVLTWNGHLLEQMEVGKTITTAGRIYFFSHDAVGRIVKTERQTTAGLVAISTSVYDTDGLLLSTADAVGHTSTRTYDLLGRPASSTDGAGGTTLSEYDAFGNLTLATDPEGRTMGMSNWLMTQPGKPLDVTDGRGKTYNAVLNALGQLRSLTDPQSQTLTESHDALGRLTDFSTPSGATTTFAYNARGFLDTRTDASAQVTSYSYNTRGAITGIDYPGPDAVIFTLDDGDRVIRAVDADSDLSASYDGLNRLLQEVDNITGRSITLTFNSIGQRATMTTSDGVTVSYEYDDLDHLKRILRNGVPEVTYVRDQAGFATQMTTGNGQVTTYTRDGVGRLETQEVRNASNDLLSRVVYTRDLSGLISVKHEILVRPDLSTAERYFHYTYDDAKRLTREESRDTDDVTVLSARDYTYDDVGNRLTRTIEGTTTTYAYGIDYRLDSETTGGASINYTYDADGNMLTETFAGDTVTYGYDAEHRVISINSPSTTATYQLSWDGRRMAKTVSGVTTGFLYDGLNAIAEYSGGSSIQYLSGTGLDEWLMRVEGGQKHFYNQLEDMRSVMQMTDSTGQVQNAYVYDAFGNLIESSVNTPNVYTFTGRRQDDESEHMYFRERLYSPTTGRFLGLDPFRPGSSRSFRMGDSTRTAKSLSGVQASPLFDYRRDVNVVGMDVTGYTYVGNNPVNATDPTGEVLLWNPVSGSVSSVCWLSGCILTGCIGSGCGGSVCGGSGCAGSGCVGSGCGVSGCGGSVCGGSGCAGSVCLGSACGGSACAGSLCLGSACVGSGCVSLSACVGSVCVGSACVGSACGGSGCLVSVCGGSACIGSVCHLSGCGGSVCAYSTCGGSLCTSSGCGQSATCSGISGCTGSACDASSGCNSPCCN